jgi:hypothetical protein
MDITLKYSVEEFLEKLDLEAYEEHDTIEVETDESGNVLVEIKGTST